MGLFSRKKTTPSQQFSHHSDFVTGADLGASNSAIHATAAYAQQRNPIAFQCAEKITKSTMGLPWEFGRGDDVDNIEPDMEMEPSLLLANPNTQTTWDQLIRRAVNNELVSGNAYFAAKDTSGNFVSPTKVGTKPVTLYVFSDRSITPVEGSIEGIVKEYKYQWGQNRATLQPDQVVHVKWAEIQSNQILGTGPATAAFESIIASDESLKWLGTLSRNMGLPYIQLILKYAGQGTIAGNVIPDENQRDAIKKYWKKATSGDNVGTPFVSAYEAKPLAMSPNEAGVQNIKNDARTDIATAYGVPPLMLGDLSKSSYSNAIEAYLVFYETVILPNADLIAQGLTKFLNHWYPDFKIGIQVRDIRAYIETALARTTAITAKVSNGIITPNTGGREMGYEEALLTPDGDVRIIASTMMALEDAAGGGTNHGSEVE